MSPARHYPPAIDRLMERVSITAGVLDTPCWVADYGLRGGYALLWISGKHVSAHRLAYEHYVGPIPQGCQLDHLCRVRNCVNPQHLEPVTNRENMLRGMSPAAITHRTGVCPRGHSLVDAYVNPQGYRRCRVCRAA